MRGSRKGKGHLRTRLRREPDRCEPELPEHRKGRPIGIGEAEHAHFHLVTRATGAFSKDMRSATGAMAQSTVPQRAATTLVQASVVRARRRSTYPGYRNVPDASSDSRSQYVEPAISAGGKTYGRRSEAIPLSDFEMDSTRRIPYGTRTAAEISSMRTTVGTSAAPDPEKK